MNTTTKPRRSGAKIMAQLIVLLGSLVYIMLLAVINGTAGFLCAMGVTLSGAAAIAKALGEEISFSYGALIALAVGCGVLRGLLRFAEQPLHCLPSAGGAARQDLHGAAPSLPGQAGNPAEGRHYCDDHLGH